MKILLFFALLLCGWSEEVISKDWMSERCRNPSVLSPSCITKFGKNENVGTSFETIWQQGSTYAWPTTTFVAVLSSSNNSDDQTMTIKGLDENRDMVSVSVALTGQTTVTVPGTWWRIFDLRNTSTTEDNFSGTVYVALDGHTTWSAGVPQTTTAIVATATSTGQASFMAIFSTARNQYAQIDDFRITSDNAQGSECWAFTRQIGKTFTVASHGFVYNAAPISVSRKTPFIMSPEMDLDVRCAAISGNSRISVVMGIYLELR